MTPFNTLALDSINGDTGDWLNLSGVDPNFSIHVYGLETGGSIQVFVANYNKFATPATPAQTDPNAALLTTITSTGAPSITPVAMSVGWLQVVKTPGTTPTETFVRIAGRQL